MKSNIIVAMLAGFVGAFVLFFVTAFTLSDNQPSNVVRAQLIELVDKSGKVRGSLKIEENDEVVFRLMDASGAIRVKLGASADGSGLILLNDETSPGIHALAKKSGTSLTLANQDGKKKKIVP